MTWDYGRPRPGEWLVVDSVYRHRSVAVYRADLGWCINGRWRGHDAVECFQAIEPVPEKGTVCARNTPTRTSDPPGASYASSSGDAARPTTRAR